MSSRHRVTITQTSYNVRCTFSVRRLMKMFERMCDNIFVFSTNITWSLHIPLFQEIVLLVLWREKQQLDVLTNVNYTQQKGKHSGKCLLLCVATNNRVVCAWCTYLIWLQLHEYIRSTSYKKVPINKFDYTSLVYWWTIGHIFQFTWNHNNATWSVQINIEQEKAIPLF